MADQKYSSSCSARGVDASAVVTRALSGQSVAALRALNAAGANVGDAGIAAVLDVVKAATELNTLNLSDNGLKSGSLAGIIDICRDHPSLTSLDLSNNSFPIGGEPLLQLTSTNTRLKALSLVSSEVRPLFTKLIEAQLRKNAKDAPPGAAQSAAVHVDSVPGADDSKRSPRQEGGAFSFGGFGGFNFGGGDEAEDPAANEDEDEDEDEKQKEDEDDIDEEADRRRRQMLAVQAGGGRRKTVSSEVVTAKDVLEFSARKVQKSEADAAWLLSHLEAIHLFSNLEDSELREVVDAMSDLEQVHSGDMLVEEGSDASKFIIIQEGEVEVVRPDKTEKLGPGESLCETGLLYSSKADFTASVTSSSLKAWTLPGITYKKIAVRSSSAKRARYKDLLRQVRFLGSCEDDEILQLADALKSTKYSEGDTLIEHGSVGRWFHIITEGTVEVVGRDDAGASKHVCFFKVGDCVGELEFIHNHVCVADVKAYKGSVKTAKMSKSHFVKVMGPFVEFLKRTADSSEVYEYYRQARAGAPQSPTGV